MQPGQLRQMGLLHLSTKGYVLTWDRAALRIRQARNRDSVLQGIIKEAEDLVLVTAPVQSILQPKQRSGKASAPP